jgi:hypothetical protein
MSAFLILFIYVSCTKTKLHGLSPQANYTDRLTDRRLSAKLVPTLADSGLRIMHTLLNLYLSIHSLFAVTAI